MASPYALYANDRILYVNKTGLYTYIQNPVVRIQTDGNSFCPTVILPDQ